MPRPAAPRKPARRPGRPRNARVDQRERLLDVAVELFSRRGIAATPLSVVARRARVTPALVHYYFGNRESLLDALVEERFGPIARAIAPIAADPTLDARALVAAFVHRVTATLDANPWLPSLWIREVLSEGGLLRDRLLSRLASVIAPRLRDRFAAAQANGAISAALDPRLLVVSMIALTVFTVAARPIWTRLFDAADIDADAIARHALALLEGGMEPRDDR